MSPVDQLAKNASLDSVRFVELQEIVEISNTGVDKKIVKGEEIVSLLNYMDIVRNPRLNAKKLTALTSATPSKLTACSIRKGDVFVTPSSETKDEIGISAVAEEDIPNAVYSYHTMRLRPRSFSEILPEYLMYLFRSSSMQSQISSRSQGITRYGLTLPSWRSLRVPIPPLSVQEEIVRILDTFAELVENLEDEKILRTKQFEHFRSSLLSRKAHWVSSTLGDVGRVAMCKRIFKDQTKASGDVPFYKIGTFGKVPDAYISSELFEEYKSLYSYPRIGDVLLSASGTIGRRVIFDGRRAYFQDSNIIWLDHDETIVLNRFLYHYYSTVDWKTEGGTISRLYNSNMLKTEIAIPAIDEQLKIVEILDAMELLTSEMSPGLGAEIVARKRQLAYYADELLSFRRLA